MTPKKKNKTRSTAKPAKKLRRRVAKAKISTKPKEQSTRKRVALKPKVKKGKRAAAVSAEEELKREFQTQNPSKGTRASAWQTEDFEGVSRAEQADSESVDELVEEGNVFESGAVAGVQAADDADEKEVQTRELPEDDVPEEYLDKD
jgi:hypothetical protein